MCPAVELLFVETTVTCVGLTHLLTQWTVVIDVQHVDIHVDGSLKLAISGCDSQSISVSGLSVQTLLHNQTPLALLHLHNGKLAERVSGCRGKKDMRDGRGMELHVFRFLQPFLESQKHFNTFESLVATHFLSEGLTDAD